MFLSQVVFVDKFYDLFISLSLRILALLTLR